MASHPTKTPERREGGEPRPPFGGWWKTTGLTALGFIVVLGVTLLFPKTTDEWANKATVWALYWGLVALGLTVWTVAETQRATKESARRTEAAVKQAEATVADAERRTQEAMAQAGATVAKAEATVARQRQETRQILERISLQLLREESEAISRLIPEALSAADRKEWFFTIDKLQEAKRLMARLQQSGCLLADEKEVIKGRASDLEQIISHVRGKASKPAGAPGTAPAKREPLEKITSQVEIILARIRQLMLELPHAD